jgi:hypothetical protein
VGIRALGVALALGASIVTLSATTGRDENVSTRPMCAELYQDGRPTGTCCNWPDNPVSAPTSSYDGRRPPEPDRRPVEQNPSCWIADAGWPRCREWNERTDTR